MVQERGADMLQRRLGSKYEAQRAPPSTLHFLNTCGGSFKADLGDNPHTACSAHIHSAQSGCGRTRRKSSTANSSVEPPPLPMEQDYAGMMVAQKFMRNAQGLATVTDKQQGGGFYTNTVAYPKKVMEELGS
jgi:hypothetical protein